MYSTCRCRLVFENILLYQTLLYQTYLCQTYKCIAGNQLLSGANQAAEHQLLLALPGHHQVTNWQTLAGSAGGVY